MPLHPKAKEFAKNGLFAGLSSFEELERRISAITENKGKGDAFEVFAEAYLATQRKHDAHHVWPLDATPLDVLGKLGLGGMDYGVDGVLQTLLGDLSAYQVKFRTGREPMTWRELSTFMGLADSPHIRSRILITNCDELPPVINDRQGFFCIRGSDLDRMEVSDFQAIEAWLAEAAIQAPKKKPLPHQEEALAAIVPTLQKESRATAIMACGTGKTLVTLWTAEQLGARKILVLLPSLALLRQTLHEWLKETSLDPLAYLCVCSDPTVKGDADEIRTTQSDLDFEVSTNPEVVRRFLDAPFAGTKIVFSTYQSASVVGEAMKTEESFDLGIFDEAHKTAGREGSKLSYALKDENIAIAKRLFVTATPRHYNPRNKNKSGDMEMVYSMDRPEVFGERVYTLSFSQAAKREIICGYKVVISVITSEMVTNELINQGQVQISGDYVQARQVANQIALRDAVHKFGVKRIFTFHNTVQSAASFVSAGNDGVRNHLPEFGSFHVSGAMSTAQRERIMRDFRSSTKGIISNARCLTEGVDVPAVDMVAFLSPRRSLVDIVQATGRAMRKSPGKKLGYVLVPLYVEVETGESLDEAVARADFDEVWDVLQTMQEQDEVLADTIRQASINSVMMEGSIDPDLGKSVEVLGPSLTLEHIRAAVATQCLDGLTSVWDTNFAELLVFKNKYGHCDVPKSYEGSKILGTWVANQRQAKRLGHLSKTREERLNTIEFVWRSYNGDKTWDERLEDWKKFATSGKSEEQLIGDETAKDLKIWVNNQRNLKKQGLLTKDREAILLESGFAFSPYDESWKSFYDQLVVFKNAHGHCNVPISFDKKLAQWVTHQRRYRGKNSSPEERERLLNKIGFQWDYFADIWSEKYNLLREFKQIHGHCDVPVSYKIDPSLGRWVHAQRKKYKRKELSEERIALLNNLDFKWHLKSEPLSWEDRYNQLVRFKNIHGHCNIPQKYRDDPGLGIWVNTQRRFRKLNKLILERIKLLEQIGFAWEGSHGEKTWEERFADLKKFVDRFGHAKVPQSWSEDKSLGGWVNYQRRLKKKGSLPLDREQLLNNIGFVWTIEN